MSHEEVVGWPSTKGTHTLLELQAAMQGIVVPGVGREDLSVPLYDNFPLDIVPVYDNFPLDIAPLYDTLGP